MPDKGALAKLDPLVVLQKLGRDTSITRPVDRLLAQRSLLDQTLKTMGEMSPKFILGQLPDETAKVYELVQATVNKHVGLGVATARLAGVAGTLLKQMGELWRKEIEPNLPGDPQLSEILESTDVKMLEQIVFDDEAKKAATRANQEFMSDD